MQQTFEKQQQQFERQQQRPFVQVLALALVLALLVSPARAGALSCALGLALSLAFASALLHGISTVTSTDTIFLCRILERRGSIGNPRCPNSGTTATAG